MKSSIPSSCGQICKPPIDTVYGVDFSGARLAGRTTWIARLHLATRHIASLECLEEVAGTAVRHRALAHLVDLVRVSQSSLWAIDAPFGLPTELLGRGWRWTSLLTRVRRWRRGAHAFGVWCVRRSVRVAGVKHIYRATDRDAKAPFDPYHYRIAYQTFHAMRDVVAPLRLCERVAVLPFDLVRFDTAGVVLTETCPSSTLKRWGLPHQRYKEPNERTVSRAARRVRERILEGVCTRAELPRAYRAALLRDPGGDALDAVVAAVGAAEAWSALDLAALYAHRRYRREGYLLA